MRAKQRKRDGVLERLCNHCGEWQWIEEFVKAKSCPGGRRAMCKTCRNMQKQAWRAAKRDQYQAADRARKRRIYWSDPETARRRGRISRALYAVKRYARGLPRHNERDRFGRFKKAEQVAA